MKRVTTLILACSAIGKSPIIVVIVVIRIGRKRWPAARNIASRDGIDLFNRWKVSMRTIELFTTIPAKATMPVPVIITLKS